MLHGVEYLYLVRERQCLMSANIRLSSDFATDVTSKFARCTRRTVMPEVVDLRGARVTPPVAGLDGRRATERVGLDTRSFLEQIGQFSTSRLWRQKVGTGPVYEADPERTAGAHEGRPRGRTKISASDPRSSWWPGER